MKVDKALISKLEELARLELSEAEEARLQTDLENILEMVEKLQELDTQNVAPLIYISEEVNVLRPDVVQHQINREKALANAPDHTDEFFKVPKVIDL